MKRILLLTFVFSAQVVFGLDRFCNGVPGNVHSTGGGFVASSVTVSRALSVRDTFQEQRA